MFHSIFGCFQYKKKWLHKKHNKFSPLWYIWYWYVRSDRLFLSWQMDSSGLRSILTIVSFFFLVDISSKMKTVKTIWWRPHRKKIRYRNCTSKAFTVLAIYNDVQGKGFQYLHFDLEVEVKGTSPEGLTDGYKTSVLSDPSPIIGYACHPLTDWLTDWLTWVWSLSTFVTNSLTDWLTCSLRGFSRLEKNVQTFYTWYRLSKSQQVEQL